MRMGCNGEAASFPLIDDICGVCGGDNSTCVDCSGEKDGGGWTNHVSIISVTSSKKIVVVLEDSSGILS